MKYLTKEEIVKIQSEHSHEELAGKKNSAYNSYLGKMVVSNFGIGKAEKYVTDKEAKILDCGCAGGGFISQLHSAGYKNLYGNDIFDFRAEENKEKMRGFEVVDLNYAELKNGELDAVIAWCVLPHLDNPHNLVREAHKALKPGGLFFVSMPNIFSLSSRLVFLRYGDLPRYKAKKDHISIFTKGVLETTILKYFDLVEKDFYIRTDWVYFKATKWPEKILLLLRRFLPKKLKELIGYNVVYVLRKK